MDRFVRRLAPALILAVSAIGALATPASAEVVTQACSGVCGSWHVSDTVSKPGALCFYYYGKNDNIIEEIDTRPPKMYGHYPFKTSVAWRLRIQRRATNGNVWTNYYTSTYQVAAASNTAPAYDGHGFSYTNIGLGQPPSHYYWRVAIDLHWLHNGSLEGSMSVRYLWYEKQKDSGPHEFSKPRCGSTYN